MEETLLNGKEGDEDVDTSFRRTTVRVFALCLCCSAEMRCVLCDQPLTSSTTYES